jgi:hypothetical protein
VECKARAKCVTTVMPLDTLSCVLLDHTQLLALDKVLAITWSKEDLMVFPRLCTGFGTAFEGSLLKFRYSYSRNVILARNIVCDPVT